MSIYCPILNKKVVYLNCQDCEENCPKNKNKHQNKLKTDIFKEHYKKPVNKTNT